MQKYYKMLKDFSFSFLYVYVFLKSKYETMLDVGVKQQSPALES